MVKICYAQGLKCAGCKGWCVSGAMVKICYAQGLKCAGCKGWCVSGAMVKICYAQGLKCACARVEMCPVLGCRCDGR